MNIFAICLIKNEEDIIRYALYEGLKWASFIFVYDNGSDDQTWQIVQELAKNEPRIVPFKTESKPYHDGLRGEVFNAYKSMAKKGDWWAILDSDEFFMEDPKLFLRKVPFWYHKVKIRRYEYLVTKEDVCELNFINQFPEAIEILKYYDPQVNSEVRFMRHRNMLSWIPDERRKWPEHSGVCYSKYINVKHYKYRSPEQIQRRLKLRKKASDDGYTRFSRDMVADWKEVLISRSDAIMETPKMTYKTFKDKNKRSVLWNVKHIVFHLLGIYP